MPDPHPPADTTEPSGLSDDEIKSLFQKLWDGDESASEAIFEGNLDWLARLMSPLAEQSDIPVEDLTTAVETGLRDAISKYDKPEFSFRPDDRLQGGICNLVGEDTAGKTRRATRLSLQRCRE